MDININLVQWFIFFDKKTSNTNNEKLVLKTKDQQKKYKIINRKFEKQKVHSPSIDNIWGTDAADMLMLIKFNIVHFHCVLLFLVNMPGLFL